MSRLCSGESRIPAAQGWLGTDETHLSHFSPVNLRPGTPTWFLSPFPPPSLGRIHKTQSSFGVWVFSRLGMSYGWCLALLALLARGTSLPSAFLSRRISCWYLQWKWPCHCPRSPGKELSLARTSCSLSQKKKCSGLCRVRAQPEPSPWSPTTCPDTPALPVLSLPCPSLLFSLLQSRMGQGGGTWIRGCWEDLD